MTYSKQREFNKRKPGRPRKNASGNLLELTFANDLHEHLAIQTREATSVTFPSTKWQHDPVGFMRNVLGVEPWMKQREILEAIRDHARVCVKSGHKVSKSHTAAGIALWFYCSFTDARVIMTSTTARQVDQILWRETRMMRARSGRCVDCKKEDPSGNIIKSPCPHSAWIDGEMGELARTGLKSPDFREIVGFTAREAEAVAGISGKNLLYILDEASGIKPEIYEAIEGNRAGGARVVMFSNPTRTTGDFYDAFNEKKRFYSCHTISSEDTPNVQFGEDDPRAIPGLATREWVEEKKEEWGEDSPLYLVRVKGLFAELDAVKIFPIHKITEAELRWQDAPTLLSERLYIGFDPAGESAVGDESIWTPVRGYKQLSFIAERGMSAASLLVHTLGIVAELKYPREVPVVIVDVEGEIGYKVNNVFAAYLEPMEDPPFELVAMRSSDGAHRNPVLYDRQRDELCGNLLAWINDGGAIIEDAKLAKELLAMQWIEQEKTGKVKLVAKKELKKTLKRSPDRYDSLALAVWRPVAQADNKPKRKQANVGAAMDLAPQGMDPYAHID